MLCFVPLRKNDAAADLLARCEFLFDLRSKFDCWKGGRLDAARYLAQERFLWGAE